MRPLCGLEQAVVEGEKPDCRLVPRALRVCADASLCGLQAVCGGADRHDGVARILPVDGGAAAAADDPAIERDAEVLRLGEIADPVFPQNVPCEDGVKIRAVIAHEKDRRALRQQLQAMDIHMDAKDGNGQPDGAVQQPAIERRVVPVFLFCADQQRADGQQQTVDRKYGQQPQQEPSDHTHGTSFSAARWLRMILTVVSMVIVFRIASRISDTPSRRPISCT